MVRRRVNELTEKERRFCEAYVLGLGTIGNGSASVRAAGYATKHPARIAHKVLRRPLVQREIVRLRLLRELLRTLPHARPRPALASQARAHRPSGASPS